MSYVRTKEHRQIRSQMIHQWKPWLNSIGAKTEQGKAVSSMNAYKGGVRQKQRELNRQLNEQMKAMLNLLS